MEWVVGQGRRSRIRSKQAIRPRHSCLSFENVMLRTSTWLPVRQFPFTQQVLIIFNLRQPAAERKDLFI